MAQIEVSALDPITAFVTTVKEIIEITEVMRTSDSVPPLDFLRAVQHGKDTLNGIVFAIMASTHALTSDKIPEDAREAFQAEIDAEQIARIDETPQQMMERLRRLLAPFSTDLDIDPDDLPPGFPRPNGAI